MKYPAALIERLANLKDTLLVLGLEFGKSAKYEHNLQCDVLVVYPTGRGEWFKGKTDEADNFLFVPLMKRIWRDIHPIEIGRKRICVVSSNYHGTLNLVDMGKAASKHAFNGTIKYAVDPRLAAFMRFIWSYKPHIVEFEVKNVPGAVNLNLYDNPESFNFTSHSFQVLQTKAFQFMEEPSRKLIIMIAIVCGLFGAAVGAVAAFMGALILFWVIK